MICHFAFVIFSAAPSAFTAVISYREVMEHTSPETSILNPLQTFVSLLSITVFPHIVSSLEYFPPLNSFLTFLRKLFKFSLHRRKTIVETIWIFQGFTISKKNSWRGNYMRKYSMCSETIFSSKVPGTYYLSRAGLSQNSFLTMVS